MSADIDDLFFGQVEQLLSTLDEEEEEYDELELDPYNPEHIDYMQQFIINNNTNGELICANDTTSNNSINKILIQQNEYGTIDEFNHYLASLIINILEYAQDNKKLFHLNETNKKGGKYRSSYDEMMKHIPRHNAYPALSPSSSYTAAEGVSSNRKKSKIFRSMLMQNENVEIISNLETLRIDHFVNIESLKLIHDIIQLTKQSLINVSFQFTFYNANHTNNNNNENIEIYEQDSFFKIWNRNSLNSNISLKSNVSFDNNMMISCISSILKLCETMDNLESFNFNLIDFNRECYDYFTHFDTDSSDIQIFKNLKHLTIHIDDKLSQSEVSSFKFYASSASPILAFLKKLKVLQSISIVINLNETCQQQQQYQFIYFIKKLCEKIFEILNKSHPNLHEFYFKNLINDCDSIQFFIENILINFIKSHTELHTINIILYDLCDENLANLIQSIYYTDSKMKYKSCIKNLQQLSLCSKTCIDSNTFSQSLRHHYGDISISALLHLIYNSNVLQKLSLICFYGADTIKFNALISAINTKTILNHFEIAQLRKDSDTLYSLSKLFKPANKRKHSSHSHLKLSWNFYESLVISFGAQFAHFYHGEQLKVHEMKKLIDLILQNQLLLQENKLNLLNLISIKINKNFKLFIPNHVLFIIVQFSCGYDCLNISLLQWNLSDPNELHLLFEMIKYFKMKYDKLINTKTIHRNIHWFHNNWAKNVTQLDI